MSKHYRITIKEVGLEKPIVTDYVGNKSLNQIIEFYGLKEPDVEWYKIKEL